MSTAKITRPWSLFALLSGFLFLLFFSSSVLAATAEIEAVKQEIWNKGARWLAAETSISKLPVERRRKRVGLFKPASLREEGAILQSTLPVVPPDTNYVNYSDYQFVTPVRDQGDCGSCWAFAATAALESQVLINGSGAGASTLDLSEETLLSCCGARVCGDCNGGWIDSASDFIQTHGLPDESCFPYPLTYYDNYYNTHKQKEPPPPTCSHTACPYWHSNTDAITSWHWVALTSPTVAGMKSALYYYGPLVTTMNVYDDFFHYKTGVYSHVSGVLEGGHAVTIVGYDDDNRCFIVKNSWGTGWGENGFFRIDYNQINNQVQFGYFTIAYGGYKAIQSTCSYAISPQSRTVTYAGGYAYESVSTQAGCPWTAVSNVAWIKVVSGAKGATGRLVRYYIYPNSSSAQRVGTLTIAGKTLTITQTGKPQARKR